MVKREIAAEGTSSVTVVASPTRRVSLARGLGAGGLTIVIEVSVP